MIRYRAKAIVLTLLGALCVSPALAQTTDDPFTRSDGIRDRFRVNVGAFFVTHQTFALLNAANRPPIPGIDLESETALPDATTDFRIQAHFKPGRRHKLFAAFYTMRRSSLTRLEGEIEWDGETFPIGADISAKWNVRVFKFEYRYAIIKRERFDVGLSLGLFAMEVESGMGFGTDLGAIETDVKEAAPLPMLGGGVEWYFARGWTLRAAAQYLGLGIEGTLDGKWGEV